MLTGKSVYHVNQGLGKAIDKGGYYNDLTQKVLMGDNNLDENGIPFLEHSDGSHIQMPTMIFQYGLGAYDLWLIEGNKSYLDRAILCAEWAIEHQNKNGSWNNFFYIFPDNPYSAMPQGEGASLLLRIYSETNDKQWLNAAKKSIDYMLMDIRSGGVSEYTNDDLFLYEYTHLPLVLNGWIFAIFGLYDLSLQLPEYKPLLLRTLSTLKHVLPQYDNGYWSLYNDAGAISSPFYHNLQIAQLKAVYLLTNEYAFDDYSRRWEKFQKNTFSKNKAFLVKVIQKIIEK